MLALITTAWNKAKYWIIGGGLAILYLLGYQKGKHKEQVKTMKGTIVLRKTISFSYKP